MARIFTEEQYTKLKEAIVTGVKTVTYGDKTVSYRSLDEMERVLSMMEDELFPERMPRRRYLVRHDRDFFRYGGG